MEPSTNQAECYTGLDSNKVWRIQDFPNGGRQPLRGEPTYDLANLFPNTA